ncbi:EamA family transporter [Parapedobacter sp.]
MTTVFTKDSHSRATVFVAFAMIYIVWGSTFFFIHKALAGFEPFLLGAVRFSTAGLLLLGWCALKGYRIFDGSTIFHGGLMGLLLLFVDNGIIIWVEQFMPSGLVAIMSASAAIWFIILDKPNWKANFHNLPVVVGLFMGFFGVVMLFGDRIAQAFDASERQANIMGMTLLLLGALAWTVGSLYSKYFGNPKSGEKRNSMVSTAWQMLIAGIAFTITAAARGEVANFQPASVPPSAWWAITYLIFMGSIVAYSSYIWLLQVRPATEVSTHTYVNPIVAVLLGAWFAHEAVTTSQVIALTVILASVLLINWEAYNLASLFTKRSKRFTHLREKANIRATIRASIPARSDGKARDTAKDEF